MAKGRRIVIPFDFSYARPETAREAVTLWRECRDEGKRPVYCSGGTEIITLCREMKIKPDLVIDIKAIAACHVFEQHPAVTYGAALSLNTIATQSASGLVARSFSAIGDHTVRNQVTLGGNIMGQLPFREALLPFLVLGGKAKVIGEKGTKEIALFPYHKRVSLKPGELVTSFSLDPEMN
jgi:CO/xanthine dehydrogenase FAD-binding subunit